MLRHAKAAQESSDGTDHGRPLTKRGRSQAEATVRFLRDIHDEGEDMPRLVLSSSALRARETAELILPGLGTDVSLEIERDLYEADTDDVIERLRELDAPDELEAASSVIVVGHNPTVADLVELLLSEDDAEGRSQLGSFPTCALAQIALSLGSWSDLEPGVGRLERLFVP